MSLNVDLPPRLDELRRDRVVLICDDTFDPLHIRRAVAGLDAQGIHPEVARMVRAHAEKVLPPEWREDIGAEAPRPPPVVLDYSTPGGWTRLVRRGRAERDAFVDPRGCAVVTHAGPNRAQRRSAR